MSNRLGLIRWMILGALFWAGISNVRAAEAFPPGWLPVNQLDDKPTWREVRDIKDRIHLYLPRGKEPVRGVFACFVFHSGDPRELANLWNFALVTVPWPFEYDLGVNDKRNGRFKLGHEMENMGLLLRYLDQVGRTTGHPELSTVPIVGWLGQNGSRMCADLYAQAPKRVLAWADSFPNRLRQYPELTQNVPFAFAWEASKKDLREGVRSYRADEKFPADLSCRASTYGHGHGIYSKFNFFMFFLDRCIAARLPDKMPAIGQPVPLKPVARDRGWVGDFDPISGWNPIATAADGLKAKHPVWLPDAYAAASWRAYHSACTDLEIMGPRRVYAKINNQWGGGGLCGLGYGGYLDAKAGHLFAVKMKGDYTQVEYFDGDQSLGTATAAPWELKDIKLSPGLRVLYAVGQRADGTRAATRPAMVIVK